MKLFITALVLVAASIQMIAALKCMQGIVAKETKGDVQQKTSILKLTECVYASAEISEKLVASVKPNITAGDGPYQCYHLKVHNHAKGGTGTIRGCISRTVDVCKTEIGSGWEQLFCSQCMKDGCNSGDDCS